MSRATERIVPIGLACPVPTMSGGGPWVGVLVGVGCLLLLQGITHEQGHGEDRSDRVSLSCSDDVGCGPVDRFVETSSLSQAGGREEPDRADDDRCLIPPDVS